MKIPTWADYKFFTFYTMYSHQINGDTPLFQLTVNQLIDLIKLNLPVSSIPAEESGKPQYIYGLKGLAKLLDCSHPTAQKLKNSGRIPYAQVGRKLVFEKETVLAALHKTTKKLSKSVK